MFVNLKSCIPNFRIRGPEIDEQTQYANDQRVSQVDLNIIPQSIESIRKEIQETISKLDISNLIFVQKYVNSLIEKQNEAASESKYSDQGKSKKNRGNKKNVNGASDKDKDNLVKELDKATRLMLGNTAEESGQEETGKEIVEMESRIAEFSNKITKTADNFSNRLTSILPSSSPPQNLAVQLPAHSPSFHIEKRQIKNSKPDNYGLQVAESRSLSMNSFEEKCMSLRNEFKREEDEMKLKKAMEYEESKEKFIREQAEHEEQQERYLRMLQKEIEDFEQETREIIEKQMDEMKMFNLQFAQYLRMNQQFEEREKEFAQWLDTIKESVVRAKSRFSLFHKIMDSIKWSARHRDIQENELSQLHSCMYSAYTTVYQGWRTVKQLSNSFPDRIFLFILQKQLVSVANKICNVLMRIDDCKTSPYAKQIRHLRNSVSKLDAMEISQTWQLREQSEIEPRSTFNFNEVPRIYERSDPEQLRIEEHL